MGHALDEIAEYGASKLFGEVAFGIALENNLLGDMNHLDTTSLSVQGEYEVEDKASVIRLLSKPSSFALRLRCVACCGAHLPT